MSFKPGACSWCVIDWREVGLANLAEKTKLLNVEGLVGGVNVKCELQAEGMESVESGRKDCMRCQFRRLDGGSSQEEQFQLV